ncbi:hypothetical protein EAG_11176 [Camponotus floridanus]|uniref:Uncharacterized protein n=1 Tax=Camponotus floridanus TaxID=104421 RepID=E2A0I2_CAMFO|nr:hypothetical protein EAG_11176 [Camponotus floridanus]
MSRKLASRFARISYGRFRVMVHHHTDSVESERTAEHSCKTHVQRADFSRKFCTLYPLMLRFELSGTYTLAAESSHSRKSSGQSVEHREADTTVDRQPSPATNTYKRAHANFGQDERASGIEQARRASAHRVDASRRGRRKGVNPCTRLKFKPPPPPPPPLPPPTPATTTYSSTHTREHPPVRASTHYCRHCHRRITTHPLLRDREKKRANETNGVTETRGGVEGG